MRCRPLLTPISLLALVLGVSGCASLDPTSFIAKRIGAAVGTRLADTVPAPATTAPTGKGGNFCDTARALKAPVAIVGLPRNQATEFALAVDEFGAANGCWPSPK